MLPALLYIRSIKLKKWYNLGPFTIFDLETTGMSPSRNMIVEIAAIRIDLDGQQTKFHSLINPCCAIPFYATNVHHITDEMVKDAPKFHDIGYEFMEFIKKSTLVAHNGRFDLGFLQESLSRSAMHLWSGKTMDSIPLIKQAFPGLPSYSLGYLRERFGLGDGTETAHRAFTDVEWTLEIFAITMKAILEKTTSK